MMSISGGGPGSPWGRLRARLTPKPKAPAAPVVRTAVVTDSAAALPAEWLAELPAHVRVIGMPVLINDDIFEPGELDDPALKLTEQLSLALAMGQPVKTSRPSPGAFARLYRELAAAGYESIVSIHLSSKLSGTVEAARLAAAEIGLDVTVVDSLTAAMCQGFAVMQASTTAAAGGSAEEVAAAAQTVLSGTSVLFYVPSLEQLRRGGRIGAASSLIGTLLAVKPILGMKDGLVSPVEKVRTAPKALARLQELSLATASRAERSSVRLAVHHFGSVKAAEELRERLAASLPGVAAPVISELPAVIAAHVGLGVLAVVVSAG